jgi:hypothetical protein
MCCGHFWFDKNTSDGRIKRNLDYAVNKGGEL